METAVCDENQFIIFNDFTWMQIWDSDFDCFKSDALKTTFSSLYFRNYLQDWTFWAGGAVAVGTNHATPDGNCLRGK